MEVRNMDDQMAITAGTEIGVDYDNGVDWALRERCSTRSESISLPLALGRWRESVITCAEEIDSEVSPF
jgi:hypothetical protein